jgi:uncharacterized Zn finger protein
MNYYFASQHYVSMAEKRRRAEREVAKLRKRGKAIAPVRIEGRKIAKSFWGQSWCTNLERYSDFENRLPRGRTYVRNGSVVDLQIAKGEIAAMVAGSDLYKIRIAIAPVKKARWKAICRDCAGSIDSLVELLQGRLAKGVMDRVCREGDGLFPSPGEIKLNCSCPDWAGMCKHVAAVLYGVGARLDEDPQFLFVLRGVDENELIATAGQDLPLSKGTPGAAKALDDSDVAALFGIEIAETARSEIPTARKQPRRFKTARGGTPATKAKMPPAKQDESPRASGSKPEPKWVTLPRARNRRARRRRDRAA